MKKLLVISLLSIFLFSTTELSQLLKLPILIEHYQEHKAQNKDLTFWDFLSLHYNQAFDHDSNDKKLPFKGHECSPSCSIIAFINQQACMFTASQNNFLGTNKVVIVEKPFIIFSILSSIWQPPQA